MGLDQGLLMSSAFVLGAGKGTRLRPLTLEWPKPLLRMADGRRLCEAAFDQLIDGVGVERLLVNTHWCAQRWREVYADGCYRGVPLEFVHEQELLDTGGGLANVWSAWQRKAQQGESLWVYNGDILATVPLQRLREAHERGGHAVTLLLRSEPGNVAFDAQAGVVADLRGALGVEGLPLLSYGGIALVRPEFERFLRPAGEVFGLVESWLRLIECGAGLGGVVVDEGEWADLGTLDEWQGRGGLGGE